METVSHHGRRTAYEHVDRGGVGPTACYVHGSGGAREMWRAQRELTDRAPMVALDLSGHGDSADVDADPGYQALSAYADDVIAVAEETDATVLVGASLGGAVALHVALERSFQPEAIVLTGTGARMGVLEDLLEWLASDFERAVEFLHGPGRLFADPDSNPDIRERSLETMLDTGQVVTRRDFLTCHRFDVRDDLEGVDVPTLLLYGDQDRLTPPWFHEYLAEEIPDARAVEIEGAAHRPMLERPAAFNEALTTFFSELSAAQ
ncbi:alpha/beta fold hydrolase [Natrarchaeobaculum aegyptiacum]|uniref:Alpha/beta hydrolase n=1 Tax=Natrarchaeobaculum aegyptiacum TaxID=745377 RepID=A0A2Z2HPV2_9EURY|nr:alpha/beta fold hydrolase [Natrarchaeobaculum aegyptiacum]ARS89090.1 alpha/beta hydrolase [Natrarchaeobaculum aegyptiacum]